MPSRKNKRRPALQKGKFAASAGVAGAVADRGSLRQTPRALLLAPYAIIPASLLVIVVDQLFLGCWIQAHFPTLPEDLLFFVIFFNLPHITASTMTFLDHDYLRHYGWRILLPAVALGAVLIGIPSLIYSDAFTAALYLWTVIHVVGQQFGLTRMLGAGFGRTYFFWKWTALATGVLIYFGIYASEKVAPGVGKAMKEVLGIRGDVDIPQAVTLIGAALLAPFLWLSWNIFKSAKNRLARWYVAGNSLTMICVVLLFALHYPFFVILIPRVLHDFSAFIFYVSHDRNRNRDEVKNIVYRLLAFSRIPVYVLCPLIAIGAAFPISYYAYLQNPEHLDYLWQGWAYRLLVFITLLHYYTDSFVWKNGALHRESILLR